MAEQLTEELLIDIEEAVAQGASTNKEIADSIGWTEGKFRDWEDGRRKNGEEESTKIHQAIKRGQSRQRKNLLRIAENSLVKLVGGYQYQEVKEEISDLKGTTTVTTTKYKEPNTTAVLFTLVNNGEGKYKSINNVQNTVVVEKTKYEVECED